MASDQSGQGQRIQQPGVSLTQGPASQPHCPHGQPQSLSLCGLLKGEPPFHHTGICMVCLSFEQSMLKKKKKKQKGKKTKKQKKQKQKRKKERNPGGCGGGGLFAKPCCVDFCSALFYTCLVFIQGASMWQQNSTEHYVQQSSLASCPGYQRNVCRSAAWQPGPCHPSQSQAMPTWDPDALCSELLRLGLHSLASTWGLAPSAFACVCLKRTVLICTREGRAACWAAHRCQY